MGSHYAQWLFLLVDALGSSASADRATCSASAARLPRLAQRAREIALQPRRAAPLLP